MLETFVLIQKVMLLLLLFCFVYYVGHSRNNKSLLIALSTVFVGEFFMFSIEDWLWEIENKKVLWFFWFNTFAWCDMGMVYCVFKLHQRDYIPFSFAARSVIYSYLFLATAQLIAYLDRAYLKTQVIIDIYQLLVPAVAISVMLVLFYIVGTETYFSYKEKRRMFHAG